MLGLALFLRKSRARSACAMVSHNIEVFPLDSLCVNHLKPMSQITPLQWNGDHVRMIDQRRLPNEEVYVNCYTAEDVFCAIKDMVIRGAPAIGVAAAMGVALHAKKSTASKINFFKEEILKTCDMLYEARPTAVNLRWGLEKMKLCLETFLDIPIEKLKLKLEAEAIRIYEEDIAINKKMGQNGKGFIKDHMNVLTHCNAGALATAGYGTALGVIRAAYEDGRKFHVYTSETRPYLQGLRLTSWELYKEGIPHTVITDNMAAWLMVQKKVDAIFVGADRIAQNGDTANKIGTYALAVLAKYHKVPLYVVAPTSTIDLQCPDGSQIPIEERDPKEVTHIKNIAVGLKDAKVYNPSFDVTPHELITAIVTEKGIVQPLEPQKIKALFS